MCIYLSAGLCCRALTCGAVSVAPHPLVTQVLLTPPALVAVTAGANAPHLQVQGV